MVEPSAEEAIEDQLPLVGGVFCCVQVFPELVESQTAPPFTTAASFVPSEDEATAYQLALAAPLQNHEVPELVDIRMPRLEAAANLVPSGEDTMSRQGWLPSTETQVLPESTDL